MALYNKLTKTLERRGIRDNIDNLFKFPCNRDFRY